MNPAHAESIPKEKVELVEREAWGPKGIAKPISKYALQKMGTPGFMISKYMNYRKLLTASRCTTSEKLNFAANLLTLAGDITNHILSLKYAEKLKDEFGEKKKEIKKYLEENKDNILSVPRESGERANLQMMAYDYAIKTEEYTEARLEVLKKFKYPALALFLTANIINAKEALAETGTLGAYSAAVQACKTAELVPRKIADQAIDKTSDIGIAADAADAAVKAGSKAPFYLRAFQKIKDTVEPVVKTISDAKSKLNAKSEKNVQSYGGLGPLTSANYAEEMIVGVIASVRGRSNEKGLGNAIKNEAIDIGLRVAVRMAVKANITAVDGFMRTSVGRGVVYAYNIWVMYSEFDSLRDQTADARMKAGALREARARFSEETAVTDSGSVRKDFEEIFQTVVTALIQEAHAADPEALPEIGPVNLCLGESCEQPIVFREHSGIDSKLPLTLQDDIRNRMKTSYSISGAQKFARGEIPIQDLDQNSVKEEILLLEKELNALSNELDKKKIQTWDQWQLEEEKIVAADLKWYASLMPVDFATRLPVRESSSGGDVAEQPQQTEVSPKPAAPVESEITETSALKPVAVKKPEITAEYEYYGDGIDVHPDSGNNLWSIITRRYQLKKLSNGTPE